MTAVATARDDAPVQRKGGAETTGRGTTPPPPQNKQRADPPPPPPAEPGLRCPRCESPNTKFCYYNNYSLSQPRHFCKACRRYWTKGGALRNVPVGGGCRKNKRTSSSAAAAASRLLALNLPVDGGGGIGVSVGVGGAAAADQQPAAAARLGLLVGGGAPVVVSPSPIGGGGATSADYQYQQGVVAGVLAALPRLQHAPAVGQYVSFGEWPSSGPAVDLTGGDGNASAGHAMNSSSIASSIESLSFVNQDLHWKLHQQRLATMFVLPPPPSSGAAAAAHVVDAATASHVGAAFLHNMAAEGVPPASWFMDTSYVLPCPLPPPANTATAIATTTNCNIDIGRRNGDDDRATSNNNCGSGIPASWGDMSTFTVLP
ncbi:hypothetical protein EJB05_50573, partial [Eragrostis curvula]